MSESFESFCRMEYGHVFRAAYALCGDREVALEATQEAFARALARWKRLSAEPWKTGWVMTTALNFCRSNARLRRRLTTLDHRSRQSMTEPATDARVDAIAALRRLPARQKQAVILHYIGDLPVAAVAELMGTSEGTVKAYLFRARGALRLALTDRGSGTTYLEVRDV